MAEKLYIAARDVWQSAYTYDHLYLIYDPDVDGDGDPTTYTAGNESQIR